MEIRIQGASEAQNGIYYSYDNQSVPLGQGGMGVVYEGYCFREGNTEEYVPVAIKLVTNTSADLIERARREASIQIDHPNLLRMWGFIPNMEPDPVTGAWVTRNYVVMERLVGVDLYNLLEGSTIDKSGRNIDYAVRLRQLFVNDRLGFVKEVMGCVMRGIDALHRSGYIHRDIDPSNVMITADGAIKLIDFGIAKTFSSLNETGHKLTQTGAIIGKVDYAAPEIVTGDVMHHNVTTDIYALGVLLYQVYTGALPFSGSDSEIMQMQLNTALPVSNIDDPSIRRIVAKATQKNQKLRYQSVTEMMGDFESISGTDVQDSSTGLKWWALVISIVAGLVSGALVIGILAMFV